MSLEIDNKIAELKGWINENALTIGSKPKWIDEFGFLSEEVPNYSSNLHYAWQLFESLGKSQIYQDKAVFGENKYCCTIFDTPNFKQASFAAPTVTEAICRAWIFLKENERAICEQ